MRCSKLFYFDIQKRKLELTVSRARGAGAWSRERIGKNWNERVADGRRNPRFRSKEGGRAEVVLRVSFRTFLEDLLQGKRPDVKQDRVATLETLD